LAAVEEAAEHVLAEVVGTEYAGAVLPWLGVRQGDELVGRVRCDQWSEEGDGDEDDDEDHADPRAPELHRAGKQRRRLDGRGRRVDAFGQGGGLFGGAHSRVLSLGVTKMVATSASRLSTTYTAAMSIASAWTTGMSWLMTASLSARPMPV